MTIKIVLFNSLMAILPITLISQTNILHLNLCSHNEMSDIGYGVNYNINYTVIKEKAIEIADSVYSNNAKWNMQVESNFIRACIQFDNAANNTNDLMELMDNLPYVEVDPHNHLNTNISNSGYNPYNYADLNHLLDSCGLTTRTNVGGFIFKAQDWANADENWTLWKNGLQGRSFPWVVWTPVVLWGGGTLNHVNDPHPSGVWRPKGPSTSLYLLNDPSQLLSIGNSCAWLIKDTTDAVNLLAEINNYIIAINSTIPNENTFYTATIMFDFRYILNPGYIAKIAEVLREIKPQVDAGNVVWQTLTEKRSDWQSTHNNTTDYFIRDCSDISTEVKSEIIFDQMFNIYPNPVNDFVIIENKNTESDIYFKIFNILGEELKYINLITENKIDVSNLQSGIYFISTSIEGRIYTRKLILK